MLLAAGGVFMVCAADPNVDGKMQDSAISDDGSVRFVTAAGSSSTRTCRKNATSLLC